MSNIRAQINTFVKLMLAFIVIGVIIFWVVPTIYKLARSTSGFDVDDLTEKEKNFFSTHLAIMSLNGIKYSKFYLNDTTVYDTFDMREWSRYKAITGEKDCAKEECILEIKFSQVLDDTPESLQELKNFQFKYFVVLDLFININGNSPGTYILEGTCVFSNQDLNKFKYKCSNSKNLPDFEISLFQKENNLIISGLRYQFSGAEISWLYFLMKLPSLKSKQKFYDEKPTTSDVGTKLELVENNRVVAFVVPQNIKY